MSPSGMTQLPFQARSSEVSACRAQQRNRGLSLAKTFVVTLTILTAILAPGENRAKAIGAAPSEHSPSSVSQEPIVVCHTSQGNGFNWAATLAWWSESFAWQAKRALQEFPNPLTRPRFDVQCVSGSSSAAASTVLLSAVLENPNLGWTSLPVNPRKMQATDLLILSRALRLIAWTADFTWDEQLEFTARYVVPEDSGQGHWWSSRYGADLIRQTLGKRILFATRITHRDLMTEVPAEDSFSNDISKVTDIIEFPSAEDLPKMGDTAFAKGKRFLERQRQRAQQIFQKKLGPSLRERKREVDTYLDNVPVPDGFVTTTFALIVPVTTMGSDSLGVNTGVLLEKHPPAFARLRTLVLGNPATLQAILNSAEFRRALSDPQDRVHNFVFGSVARKTHLLRMSQAEPENERRLAGTAADLGITGVFDPRAQDGQSNVTFEDPSRVGLVIAGGWTSPETTAWPLALFQSARTAYDVVDQATGIAHAELTEFAAFTGLLRELRFFRFGKPGRTASFPRKVLETYFFRNEDGSVPSPANALLERNLDAYYADSENFDHRFEDLFASSGVKFETNKFSFNWDGPSRPAAAANASQRLFLKVVAAFREELAKATGVRLPYVFAPDTAETETVPEPR